MKYIYIPESGIKLVEGNIIMLAKYPNTKWVIDFGWYEYEGTQYNGWFIKSIIDGTLVPVNEDDLVDVTVVSTKSNDAEPPFPWPYPPRPCPPPCPPTPRPPEGTPAFYSQAEKQQLRSAFITVQNIEERDKLDTANIPNGKLIRVNDVDGEVKYYEWSVDKNEWEPFNLITAEMLDDIVNRLIDNYIVDNQVATWTVIS